MHISKRSLVLLIMVVILCPLMGNKIPFGLYNIEKIEKCILFILPMLYFISFGIDLVKNKKIKDFLSLNSIKILSILFVISMLLSILFGIHFDFNVITNFLNYLYIIGFLHTILFYQFDQKDIKKIIIALLSIFTTIGILGIIQYFFKLGIITRGIQKYPGSWGRIAATMSNATILDKYLVFNYILLLYTACKYNKTKFCLILPALIIGTLALGFTYSRTGIICFYILSLLFFIIFIFKKKYTYSISMIVLIILMFLIPGQKYVLSSSMILASNKANSILGSLHFDGLASLNNKVTKKFATSMTPDLVEESIKPDLIIDDTPTEEESNPSNPNSSTEIVIRDDSNVSRIAYQKVAKQIIKEYPVNGIGIGNYNFIYKNQNINNYLEKKVSVNEKYLYPHNQFLHLAAEIGIVGLGLLILILLNLTILAFKNGNGFVSTLLLGFLFIACLTESIFYQKDIAFWFIITFTLLSNSFFKKSYDSKS